MTDHQATVIEMMKNGLPVDDIANATGLSVGEIAAIAHEAGLTHEYTRELMRSYLEALTWGEHHDSAKIQALATRARTALDELVLQRKTAADVAVAESEVAKLQQQLAEAQAKLRQAKGKPTSSKNSSRRERAIIELQIRGDREQIRKWARANGYEVKDRGALSSKVLDAYRRASRSNSSGPAPAPGR